MQFSLGAVLALADQALMIATAFLLSHAVAAVFTLLCQQVQQLLTMQHKALSWGMGSRASRPIAAPAALAAPIILLVMCCSAWAPHLLLLLVPGSVALCCKQQQQHWGQIRRCLKSWAQKPAVHPYMYLPTFAAATAVAVCSTLGVPGWQFIQSAAAAAFSSLQQHPLLLLASLWATVELFNYLFIFRPKFKSWNAHCNAHSSLAAKDPSECYALFQQFMAFTRSRPCEERCAACYAYLSTWFRGAPLDNIKQGNMEELFAYGFFYRTRSQMSPLGLAHLPAQLTSEFESTFNLKFTPGYNPNLKFMSHLWDDLRVVWCPLAFYAVMEGLSWFTAVCMWAMGFKRRQLGDLHYYTRSVPDPINNHTTSSSSSTTQQQQQQQPVVFIHGVMGLLLYLPLLHRLAAQNTPLLVMDMKHIALRISTCIPTIDSLTNGLAAAIQHHKLSPALVLAHSYGTLIAARLLRLHGGAVDRVLLVDPVCFGMFMPRLLHAFLYAPLKMSLKRPIDSAFNLVLWLITKEIHMAATFARRFYWSDLNLWPEELPPGSVVLLSGGDALVASHDVYNMLQSQKGVTVLMKPGLIHGGFLLSPSVLAEVCANIKTLMNLASVASAAAATATAAAAATASASMVAEAMAAVATAATAATAASNPGIDDSFSESESLDDVVAELSLLLPAAAQQQQQQQQQRASHIKRQDLEVSADSFTADKTQSLYETSNAIRGAVSSSSSCSSGSLLSLPARRLTVGCCYPDWYHSSSSSSSSSIMQYSVGEAAAGSCRLSCRSDALQASKPGGSVVRRATVHAVAAG